MARRRGLPVAQLLDVAAPATPVAQAIGRLGNWFNQELFGRPTDLPWGLEIDRAHRPLGLRVNLWVSGLALVAAGAVIITRARRSSAPADRGLIDERLTN